MKWAIVITLYGGFLRFNGLGKRPLWIDEALYAFWVRDGGYSQEFIPIWFGQLIGAESEFALRLCSALCGTLTVFAVWYVTRNLWATGFVAVFPLFVFWSQMARPYAVAGLFIVLGWRWWWFYIPALMTTPVAIAGVRVTKSRLKLVIALFALALVFFLIRPDVSRGWTLEMLVYHSRLWYVPTLAGVLYLSDFVERKRKHQYKTLAVV